MTDDPSLGLVYDDLDSMVSAGGLEVAAISKYTNLSEIGSSAYIGTESVFS